MNTHPRVWLAYPYALTFSGKTALTQHIYDELKKKGWDISAILFPPFDRSIKNPIARYLPFIGELLTAWYQSLKLIFVKSPVVYWNHGLSLQSFIRMGIPHVLVHFFNPSARHIISLHGHVFMDWKEGDFDLRLFKILLRRAQRVTVSGSNQKLKLIEFGVPADEILNLANLCEFQIVEPEWCIKKHDLGPNDPVKLLHLSLLIESKGYPEYLEGLEILSKRPDLPRPVEAVLCGPLHFTRYCERFLTPETKEAWILEKVDSINKSKNVKVTYVKGAWGEEAVKLFKAAHIFVFSSQYKVEAQPLVLLNAMGGGSAIITANTGEIVIQVNEDCAIVQEKPTGESVASALMGLFNDDKKRLDMSLAGIKLANAEYSMEKYVQTWEDEFDALYSMK